MVANGSWVNSNNKDMKIVALTTQLKQATKKLNKLKKKVQNPSKSNSGNKKTPKSSASNSDTQKKTTKDHAALWCIEKKSSTIKHEGTKYNWCPYHKSKYGSINSMYMPYPHDHDALAKAKVKREEKFKRGKCGTDTAMGKANNAQPAKNHKAGDLKLKLSKKITITLLTQHHRSQQIADAVFTKVFKEATTGIEDMSLN